MTGFVSTDTLLPDEWKYSMLSCGQSDLHRGVNPEERHTAGNLSDEGGCLLALGGGHLTDIATGAGARAATSQAD